MQPAVHDGRGFSSWVNALNQRSPVQATLELERADPVRSTVHVSVHAGGIELQCEVFAAWSDFNCRPWVKGDTYDIRADPGPHMHVFNQVPLADHGFRAQPQKRRRLCCKQPPPQ